MPSIFKKDFLLWEKIQLHKGGDKNSLYLLLEALGGISNTQLNSLRLNTEGAISLKKDLDFIEKIWERHLFKSVPIQYLCGFTYWRDLKLMVSEKVLIPRPETEIIVDILLDKFEDNSQELFFAELGTGSGAISIAIA